MSDRYTVKFGPAVSQKGLEKALHEDGDLSRARKLKARIEFVGTRRTLRSWRRC